VYGNVDGDIDGDGDGDGHGDDATVGYEGYGLSKASLLIRRA
jgi:hypothetical protein